MHDDNEDMQATIQQQTNMQVCQEETGISFFWTHVHFGFALFYGFTILIETNNICMNWWE